MYCISVDWLQVYCISNLNDVPESGEGLYGAYTVKCSNVHTPLWQEVYTVYSNGREFATYCRTPRSSAIDRLGSTIKLHNRVLYSKSWVQVLKDIINMLGCKYVGVSRIDLAYDCNTLANDVSVQSFLSDYIAHTPMTEGHIIRSGSRRVSIQATRDRYGCTAISGMRWGSPSNDVGAYCYNKSLELLEVKDKPWIREVWEAAGLINIWNKAQWDELSPSNRSKLINSGGSADFVQRPVWRFELSIKAHGKDLLDMSTGELFRIDIDFLESQRRIEELWCWYSNKYLDFRVNRGAKRFRDYERYDIFEVTRLEDVRPVRVNLYADTGRTERICANLLERMSSTYSDLTSMERASMEYALSFLRTIAGAKAGIVRLKKELSYLNHIAGYRSKTDGISMYLDYVDFLHRRQIDCDSSMAMRFCESLEQAVVEEDMRCRTGYTSDKSPVW